MSGAMAVGEAATGGGRARGRFTVAQRVVHWGMAVCVLFMLFIGVGMVSTVAAKYLTLVSIHKPLGIAILVLVVLRLLLRWRSGAPALPRSVPAPMRLAAGASHVVLYGLMIAMPLLGWAMLSAGNYPVVLFPGVVLPALVAPSDGLHTVFWDLHRGLAFAFFAVILLHVAGALFHLLVRRDGVFQAMTAGRVGEG